MSTITTSELLPRVSIPPHLRRGNKGRSETDILSKAADASVPLFASAQHSHLLHGFNRPPMLCPIGFSGEHHLLEEIRAGVQQYRLQSAVQFDLDINVYQIRASVGPNKSTPRTSDSEIGVCFHDLRQERLYRICRRRPGIREIHIASLEVYETGGYISLHQFLSVKCSVRQRKVSEELFSSWWSNNGKTFNWTGLPTELKEMVIHFSIRAPNHCDHTKQSRRGRQAPKPKAREVIEKLGGGVALLRVSHQVRELTLRLFLASSSNAITGRGLGVFSQSYSALADTMNRLGSLYQCVHADGVPIDENTQALAAKYHRDPRSFPELEQYATFRHGIRRVAISMNVTEYLKFFRMTTADFQWRPSSVDFTIFQQIPHLTEIFIFLPILGQGMINEPGPLNVGIWSSSVCSRILHRQIYEKVAVHLAQYKAVKVYGFIDHEERIRFEILRDGMMMDQSTRKKWTKTLASDGTVQGLGLPECKCVIRCAKRRFRDYQRGDMYKGDVHLRKAFGL